MDVERLDALMSADAVIAGPDGAVWRRWSESASAGGGAGAVVGGVAIEESPHTIRSLRVGVLPGGEGVSLMDVRTDVPGALFFKTQWRLTWRRDDTGRWRMEEARWAEAARLDTDGEYVAVTRG